MEIYSKKYKAKMFFQNNVYFPTIWGHDDNEYQARSTSSIT